MGTGKQGVDKEGGKEGTEQEIASPWDVVVTSSPGMSRDLFSRYAFPYINVFITII